MTMRNTKKIIIIGSVAGVMEEQGVKRKWWLLTRGKKGGKKRIEEIKRERVLLAIICLPGLIMIRLKPD